jgi:hypothetical protein
MASHRHGRGDGAVETVGIARTGPVETVRPLKACDTIAFSRCMVLGVQRALQVGPGGENRL